MKIKHILPLIIIIALNGCISQKTVYQTTPSTEQQILEQIRYNQAQQQIRYNNQQIWNLYQKNK